MGGALAGAMGADLNPGSGPCVVLEVEHLTAYEYSQPVSMAQHLAVLQPLDDERQRLLGFTLELDPEPDPQQLHTRLDAWGNRLHGFSISRPHDHLRACARSRVEMRPRPSSGPWEHPEGTPSCAEVASAVRHQPWRGWLPAVEFVQPSPHVPRLEALRRLAEPVIRPHRPMLEAAIELMHRIHEDFHYRSRSTDIDTPLARVIEQRAGVCQDFAHLMIGALRICGLPARYVSGYLLTHPPAGQAPLVGADASHAWVQVWCPLQRGDPEGLWIDLDPTNDLLPDIDHVRVAVGRDFSDVTPLRGVIRGGGSHRLSVGVTTRRIDRLHD